MEKKKPRDRHLDVPAEANRDRHINFVALERGERDEADSPATGKLSADQPVNEKKSRKKNRRR